MTCFTIIDVFFFQVLFFFLGSNLHMPFLLESNQRYHQSVLQGENTKTVHGCKINKTLFLVSCFNLNSAHIYGCIYINIFLTFTLCFL